MPKKQTRALPQKSSEKQQKSKKKTPEKGDVLASSVDVSEAFKIDVKNQIDTGLACFVLMGQFHEIPLNPQQLVLGVGQNTISTVYASHKHKQTTVRSLLSLADSLNWKEQEELFTM